MQIIGMKCQLNNKNKIFQLSFYSIEMHGSPGSLLLKKRTSKGVLSDSLSWDQLL